MAALSVSCYVQTSTYDFVYDDDVQIVLNQRIRSFANLQRAFTENFWAFNASASFSNYYRPLQTLTYMIAYALGGLSPSVYHWINILLNVLASLAVFWLGWQLFQNSWIALWGALFFAAHPMHTENVAWIAGLTDVGCGLFYFLSLSSYLRFREGGKHALAWQALTFFFFLQALFYKEMALTLPLVIVLLDFAIDKRDLRHSPGDRLKRWLPVGLALLTYLALRIYALGVFARTTIGLEISLTDRVLTTLYFVGHYLQDLLVPVGQNAFHVFRPFSLFRFTEWLLPIAIVLIWTGLVWVLYRRDRILGLLSIAVVLTLIPVLNLGGVGQNVYTERYLYIPSMSFCLLASALIHNYLSSSKTKMLPQGIVALSLAFLTVQRNPVWEDNKTLYATTLAASPDAAPLRINLGKLFFGERNLFEARREFEAALDADSRAFVSSPRDHAASLLGLSSVANAEGNLDDALQYAEKARKVMPELGDVYQNLGMLMGRKGNYAEAEILLRQALELQPDNAAAHLNLGNVYIIRNDVSAAEREFRMALVLNPRAAGPRVSLGLLLGRTNRASEALALLEEALALDPSNVQAREILKRISSARAPVR